MSDMGGRPRVVLDCVVLVQAMAYDRGPAAEVLRRVESGDVDHVISKATVAELRRVLDYPEVRAIDPEMTEERVQRFLRRVIFRATVARRVPRVFHYERDARDNAYLDLAFAARADYLVSRDRDLLALMTAHTVFAKQFRHATRPLRILDPASFLKAISHRSHRNGHSGTRQ